MIWKKQLSLEQINQLNSTSMPAHLGIVFTALGENWLEATMPVDHRTQQAVGLLHGGASVVLGESIGSIASYLCVEKKDARCIGVEVNANHLKSARSGVVTCRTTALRIGKRIHVWEFHVRNPNQDLLCAGRLTVAVAENTP